VDRSGRPKDAYYVFKSYWTDAPLFCYIESHTWTERSGSPGVKRDVNVFSNCPEAELFVDGVSQGRMVRDIARFPAAGLSWQLSFTEGTHALKVLGWKEGKVVAADSMTLRYWHTKNGIADHIQLSSEPLPGGTVLVTALAVDKDGRRCLDYEKRIYFSWNGPGELLQNHGTPTRSSVIEMANGRAQIEFRPAAKGRAVIEARNQDFKGEYLVVGR
jgi:beta-galactosidase